MEETGKSVQSIDRVLDIIETLSAHPQGMSLSALSEAVGLHVSTVHRLLKTLIGRGYVRKDPESGKYRLTLRMMEVSSRVSSGLSLLPISKPYLEQLANRVQEAVHLVERDGCDIIYLYKFEPLQHLVNMTSVVGCRNPMYCTGVGKSILAELPRQEVEEIWRETDIRRYTAHTIVDLQEMELELQRTRDRGYAIDNEEHEEGVYCMAVPIRNWNREPIGAISVSMAVGHRGEEKERIIRQELQRISREISCYLGMA